MFSKLLHLFQPNFAQYFIRWSRYVSNKSRWQSAAILKNNDKSPYFCNDLTDLDEISLDATEWCCHDCVRPSEILI